MTDAEGRSIRYRLGGTEDAPILAGVWGPGASDSPRRYDINRMTPAERAICDAQLAVEGDESTDERMTRVGELLREARMLLADIVEEEEP